MKKNIFAVLISIILILSFALIVSHAKNQSLKAKVSPNQEQVSPPPVNGGEIVSISSDEAIDIALKHAGVSREKAVLFGAPSLDNDDGVPHYDIEFGYEGYEYDYEIAVADGSILKAEKEAERILVPAKAEVPEASAAPVIEKAPEPTQAPVKEKAPEPTQAPVKEKDNNSGYISVESAKQKALDDAGVKAEDAIFLKAYYDSDDIVPHYDVKFEANGYEYEYEIKASDGTVLEKDVDREDNPIRNSSSPSEYISEDEAKSLAYEHAGVKAADVKFAEVELDRDDLIVHYDIDFVVGDFEYEYEVNAETGNIIASDKEYND